LLQEDDRKLFEVAKSVGYDSDAASLARAPRSLA
jgi:hypothetical protein